MSKKFTLIPLVIALFSGSVFCAVEPLSREDLPVLKQESQHATVSKRVANLFTRSHYTPVKFNDALSSKVFERYIESLDFNKSVFLSSDIAAFEQYRNKFDNALITGKLDFTFELFNLSLVRRFERFQFSISLLENEIKFDTPDEYFFDREDATWASTQAELNEIWRQRVKYDALRLKMTGKEWPDIKEILTKRYKNAQKRLVQSKSEDAFQIVMNALSRSVEAHTSYLSP